MPLIAIGALIIIGELMVALILTPLIVRLGHHHGFTDKPDDHLKEHDEETPHVGGIIIVVHMLVALCIYHLYAPPSRTHIVTIALLLVIFVVGVIDDRIHLSISIRLCIQFTIAGIFILSGNIVTPFPFHVLNVIFTFTGILAMINAINLIDIMDGLAGIVSSFAIIGLVYTLAYYQADMFYLMLGAATVVAIIPFLIANFRPNPHKAFLGDGGSTYLGLLLAFLFIQSTNSAGESDTVVSLLVISIPVFELFFVSIIRIYHKKNPLKGSKDHFPLRLAQISGPRIAVLQISIFALFLLISGIGILHFPTPFKIIVVFINIVVYIGLWIFLARIKTS